MQDDAHIKQCVEFILEECRMVLPGIQALFGFQLIAVFNQSFSEISSMDKSIHLAAILCTVGAIACLMGPAAYHRQTHPDGIPAELCQIGTSFVRLGMGILIFSISMDIYLVTHIITKTSALGIFTGATTGLVLATTWYAFPWWCQRQREIQKTKHLA